MPSVEVALAKEERSFVVGRECRLAVGRGRRLVVGGSKIVDADHRSHRRTEGHNSAAEHSLVDRSQRKGRKASDLDRLAAGLAVAELL